MSTTARTLVALNFRDQLAEIVHAAGASLRLGFKGRYAYLQAQWPGADEALSLLRAENFEVVRYLTEAEEAEHPDEEPEAERPGRVRAERMELAFAAVEMRGAIDRLVAATGARPRLTNDGKRAWVCVQVEGEWVPVIRCRKGIIPERLTLNAAMTAARPDVAAIRRGNRGTVRPQVATA